MKSKGHLTKKQQRFCEAMIETNYNQTQAYRIAFENENLKSCRQNASRLMREVPAVREYILELQEEAFKNACITPTKILQGLNEIAEDPEATRAEKIKALDIMGKYSGMAQINVKADVDVVIEVGLEEEEEDAQN